MSADKLCPILTMAAVQKEKSLVLAPGQTTAEPEAVACQGPQCAWYVPIANPDGKIVAGHCAITLLPNAVNNVNAAIGGALEKMFNPEKKS